MFLLLICYLQSCTSSTPIPENEFSQAIVGEWLGTVGNMKESIKFKNDGTYIATLHPSGFLYNTIPDGITGTVSGTWSITGQIITLKITDTEKENVINTETKSTILEFYKGEIILKDEKGEKTTFIHEISL